MRCWPYPRPHTGRAMPRGERRGAFGKCLHAANPGHVLKRYYRIPDLPIQAYQEIWFEAANAVPRYFSRLDTQREKAQSHRRENGIKERAAFTLSALSYFIALISSRSHAGRLSPTGSSSPFRYSATSTKPLSLSKNFASSQ